MAPLHARREAFRESARNGGDLYGLSPIHPGLGSGLQLSVIGVWFGLDGSWAVGVLLYEGSSRGITRAGRTNG